MQKANVVTVIASQDGEVVRGHKVSPKDGKEYGFVRVGCATVEFSEEGFARISNRSALIKATTEVLDQVFAAGVNTVLPGRIAVLESTNIHDMGKNAAAHEEKFRKTAGSTGIVCADENGAYIYRKQFYTTNPEVQDVLVAHANGDAIREAQAKAAAAAKKGPKAVSK